MYYMTTEFVKPKTCSRCKGAGVVSSRVVYAGGPGGCFKCAGLGVVESDKATIAGAKARNEAARGMCVDTVAALEAAGLPHYKACDAVYGIDHLATHQPDRYERALVSYQNGHPGLARAIWAYTAEIGLVHYGSRQMSVDEALALLDSPKEIS